MNLPAGIAVSDDGLDLFKDLAHPGFEPRRLIVVTNQFGSDKVSVYLLGTMRSGWTAQQLAAASAPVSSGVGADPERLKLQMQGDAPEPLPDEDEEPAEPDADAPAGPPAGRPL
jgi:hypothetical protein